MRVELRHLVAGAVADVGDVEGDLDLARARDARRRQRQVREAEARVAEAVAEGIERHALEVLVGVALRDVVLVLRRHPVQVGVDRVGQLAARVVDRRTARAPRRCRPLRRGTTPRGSPAADRAPSRCRERAGVEEHERDLGVGGEHGFEQRLLRAGQVQVAAVAALGFDLQVGAEAEDHDVRPLRQGHRAGHGLGIGRADEVRALLVVDRHAGAEHLAQALHDADLARRRAVVVAGRVVLVAGRADHGDRPRLLALQRQERDGRRGGGGVPGPPCCRGC